MKAALSDANRSHLLVRGLADALTTQTEQMWYRQTADVKIKRPRPRRPRGANEYHLLRCECGLTNATFSGENNHLAFHIWKHRRVGGEQSTAETMADCSPHGCQFAVITMLRQKLCGRAGTCAC